MSKFKLQTELVDKNEDNKENHQNLEDNLINNIELKSIKTSQKDKQQLIEQKEYSENNNGKPYIGLLYDCPSFLQETPYIITGHRINFNKSIDIIKSLFMWHNETINIWSHLLGAALVAYCFYLEVQDSKKFPMREEKLTKMPIYIFLIGYFTIFILSSLMHLTYCKSQRTCNCVLKLDYIGISLGGIGKGLSFVYYALSCHPKLNFAYNSYWILSCLALFYLSTTDWFHSIKYRRFRLAMFTVASSAFFIPVLHILLMYQLEQLGGYSPMIPFKYVFAYNVTLAIGILIGFIYIFPEKYYPKSFDIIGSSHQIWHLFVVLSFVFNYMAVQANYEERIGNLTCEQSQVYE